MTTPTFASAQSGLPGATGAFLSAFADTLLPPGRYPSAGEVSSTTRLVERAATDRQFSDILVQAARAIDQQCQKVNRRSFAKSPTAVRHQIFSALEQMPDTELLGWFFVAARAEIFFHYYAQPGTSDIVGLDPAPQPTGFDNIQEPWSAQ